MRIQYARWKERLKIVTAFESKMKQTSLLYVHSDRSTLVGCGDSLYVFASLPNFLRVSGGARPGLGHSVICPQRFNQVRM